MEGLDKQLKKSLWKNKVDRGYEFFCPQCRSKRVLPFQPNPTFAPYILRVVITTAFLTVCFWPLFGLKGLVTFVPVWTAFELYFRIRMRALSGCPSCGFDLYLYLSNIKKAREEIEVFWRKKFKSAGVPYPGDPPVVSEEHSEEEFSGQGAPPRREPPGNFIPPAS